ncbi:MAG: hypothetical protein EA351_09050 [Gemmatimonadales bacterium]|nr:MAG: hypothetical protein EA351_09050 [Gemmatimonadales bacterium]
MEDTVAIDAKRILLRYGAPIAILDTINEADRIELAREVSRTAVPDRGDRLLALLAERDYISDEDVERLSSKKKRRRKTRKK